MVVSKRPSDVNYFAKINMQVICGTIILDRWWLGLTMNDISAVHLQGSGGNCMTMDRKRGGKRICRKRENNNNKVQGLRVGTLNG
jgi:hypothetical protein